MKGLSGAMFRVLWSIGLGTALFLSTPSWLDHPVAFGHVDEGEWVDPAWNKPLDLGDGRCLTIDTREIEPC